MAEGLSALTDALASDLDIQTNCVVNSIAYGSDGMRDLKHFKKPFRNSFCFSTKFFRIQMQKIKTVN